MEVLNGNHFFVTDSRWPNISPSDLLLAKLYFTCAPEQATHFAEVIDAQLG